MIEKPSDEEMDEFGSVEFTNFHCRRLKADQALHQPHVMVFSSAVDKAEWLSPALEGGADDYLSLPVTNREEWPASRSSCV